MRRDVLLGKHGTPESLAEYARVIASWEASGRRLPTPSSQRRDVTINELAAAFWEHADKHYRRADGTTTSEVNEYRLALRPLRYLFGDLTASEIGPLALKAVRELMIDGYEHPKYGPQRGLARGVINQRIGRIRRVFKWGIENEMLLPTALLGLQAVRGLQRGRSTARETEPVHPVHPSVVEKTLTSLGRPVAAMVRLQLLTGMRPGEACVMRACDLDMSGPVWLYRPGSDEGFEGRHKTAHHGHQRVIAIGPKGQQIIKPFFALDTRAYLFSPQQANEEWRAEKRRKRRSKVQPSQRDRRKIRPKKSPGLHYTTSSYAHAIATACLKAFPPPEPLAKRDDETKKQWRARITPEQLEELKRWRKAHHWHPHQLRHSAATKIRREFGLDVARVVLGHRTPAITELYAELDVGRAVEAMERLG
jgi:integrase